MQLQIVCSALWSKLPAGVDVITAEHLQSYGDVEDTLERFYAETIDGCVRQTRCDKETLAQWLGKRLITPSETRGQVFRGETETEGMSNHIVELLEAERLLHADERASGCWYELTHDRLIRPIRAVNERWQRQFDATRMRRRRERWLVGLGLGVLGAIAMLVAVNVTILWPRLKEHTLTEGRIDTLSALCKEDTRDRCSAEAVHVFDFIADYYWRQGRPRETSKLIRLLQQKAGAGLIASDYGLSRPTPTYVGHDSGDADLLSIEYNPKYALDEERMRFEWERLAPVVARRWGVPVLPRLIMMQDKRVPLSSVRVAASPASCFEPAERATLTAWVRMPAGEEQALVSSSEIAKDRRLLQMFEAHRLLKDNSEGRCVEYKAPNDELSWCLVPAWTMPILRVTGHPAVSREEVLAHVITDELSTHPEMLLGCDALKIVLQQAAGAVPASTGEAIAARGLERLRQDFIEIFRARGRGISYLPARLDTLADYPDVSSTEAARITNSESRDNNTADVALHGPWPRPAVVDATMLQPQGRYRDLADQPGSIDLPIRVELGPAAKSEMFENSVTEEEFWQQLSDLRGKLYIRYGTVAPPVQFHPADHQVVRLDVLNQDAGDADAGARTWTAVPKQVSRRLLGELGAQFEAYREWWLTAETISSVLAKLDGDDAAWLRKLYSVTDLKHLARLVVRGDGSKETGNTVRDLPWLLRSLAFWTQIHKATDVVGLANALRETQRALQPRSSIAMRDVNERVASTIRGGLAKLAAHRMTEAAALFNAAIAFDRRASIVAFLSMYREQSSLSQEQLLKRCQSSLRGAQSTPPDVPLEYEVNYLLESSAQPLTEKERHHLEVCRLSSIADRGRRPHMVEAGVLELVTRAPSEVWTEPQAWFLAERWLASRSPTIVPPEAELPAVRRLLTRSFEGISRSEDAVSAWSALQASLGPTPWGWVRDLLAQVATEPRLSMVKLSAAWWLAGFGRPEAMLARDLVDELPRASAPDEAWEQELTRARVDARLAVYDDPPRRAQRLEKLADKLRALIADPQPIKAERRRDARALLADVFIMKGDDQHIVKGDDPTVPKSDDSHANDSVDLFNARFKVAIGEGNVTGARQIVDDMRRDAPRDPRTLFVDSIFAILTRRHDFEASALAFIYQNAHHPHRYADYTRFLLFWALSENGRVADARQQLDERMRDIDPKMWAERLRQRDSMVWREMLIALYAGHSSAAPLRRWLTNDVLFREAYHASGLALTELSFDELRCEAYFYEALRVCATETDAAAREKHYRELLQKTIDTHVYHYHEYRIARFLLGRSVSDASRSPQGGPPICRTSI